jgi:hypothetical protein
MDYFASVAYLDVRAIIMAVILIPATLKLMVDKYMLRGRERETFIVVGKKIIIFHLLNKLCVSHN